MMKEQQEKEQEEEEGKAAHPRKGNEWMKGKKGGREGEEEGKKKTKKMEMNRSNYDQSKINH
jgi:hypothetical protein